MSANHSRKPFMRHGRERSEAILGAGQARNLRGKQRRITGEK
jgi:hypothetical protein